MSQASPLRRPNLLTRPQLYRLDRRAFEGPTGRQVRAAPAPRDWPGPAVLAGFRRAALGRTGRKGGKTRAPDWSQASGFRTSRGRPAVPVAWVRGRFPILSLCQCGRRFPAPARAPFYYLEGSYGPRSGAASQLTRYCEDGVRPPPPSEDRARVRRAVTAVRARATVRMRSLRTRIADRNVEACLHCAACRLAAVEPPAPAGPTHSRGAAAGSASAATRLL